MKFWTLPYMLHWKSGSLGGKYRRSGESKDKELKIRTIGVPIPENSKKEKCAISPTGWAA